MHNILFDTFTKLALTKNNVCICSFVGLFECMQMVVSFYENKLGQYIKHSLKTVFNII